MSQLVIKDLQVGVETEAGMTEILRGVDLTINSGEVHAIMGPTVPVNQRSRTPSLVIRSTQLLVGQSLSMA